MTLSARDPKLIINSKTMGVNTVAVSLAWILSEAFGVVLPAEVAVTVLGAINVLVRLFTDKPIEGLWK